MLYDIALGRIAFSKNNGYDTGLGSGDHVGCLQAGFRTAFRAAFIIASCLIPYHAVVLCFRRDPTAGVS